MEIWKAIEGYEGIYEVSNYGQVKRLVGYRAWTERILKQNKTRDEYRMVVLSWKAIHKPSMVHRLVAKAFIPNPENKPFINHLDRNTGNNHVSNLEWCTQSENIRHSFKMGRVAMRGELQPRAKLKDYQVLEIRKKYSEGDTGMDLAKEYNMSYAGIWEIVQRKNWKHI